MSKYIQHVSKCCGVYVVVHGWIYNLFHGKKPIVCPECERSCEVDVWDENAWMKDLPKPTLKPKFAWYSWLWWLYGWTVFRPYKWLIHKVLFIKTGKQDKWGYDITLYKILKDWIYAPKKALVECKFRYFVYQMTEQVLSGYHCEHCNLSGWNEDDDYFECLSSGRDYDGEYWANGWAWCPRCRHREYTSY